MSVKTDKFSNLRPSPGEDKYIEFDEEFEQWGVFGDVSGFCYSLWCSKEEAESRIDKDWSLWLGLRMVPKSYNPHLFTSESEEGIVLTELATQETHRGRGKRNIFWEACIKVEIYSVIGTGFDRDEARNNAMKKLREQTNPLIQRFDRLGLCLLINGPL